FILSASFRIGICSCRNVSQYTRGAFFFQSSNYFITGMAPYSPELNLIEGLWKWLKADVINNVFYHTTAEIRINVQAFMDRAS
ncbi:transposase, partial [Paenibacillus sp. LHD-38]